MEDFLVRRENGSDKDWYMYIGFKDMRTHRDAMINCFGSALIRPDDHSEYWFNYSFQHSSDWCQVSGITLRPIRRYALTKQQIRRIGSDIFFNIKEFICRMN